MSNIKIKTSELSGVQLDWTVAKCEGYAEGPCGSFWTTEDEPEDFKPSTDWAQGGPIIERERIELVAVELGEEWIARDYWKEFDEQSGPTPLVAAMRCYVASKLGDEVEIPKEMCDENL